MTEEIITISNLTKVYQIYERHHDRIKELLVPFKQYHSKFYALDDVCFKIKKGDTVGFLGKNGAGKSTLLKIIAGVLTKTSGEVLVKGKVASLLELGAGFNPEMTGVENIYLNGVVMGYSIREMDSKIKQIIDFADIGEFINQPVRVYSSGMFARLAFSVAINVNPEILIIDEVLSVGDIKFQQKAMRKMHDFKKEGKTILFVTHDLAAVSSLCEKAVWIDSGKVMQYGEVHSVTRSYMSFMVYGHHSSDESFHDMKQLSDHVQQNVHTEWLPVAGCESFGDGGANIDGVVFFEKESRESIVELRGGESVEFKVKINTSRDICSPGIGLVLKDRLGNSIFGIGNYIYEIDICNLEKDQEYIISLAFEFPHISNGEYSLTVALSEGTQSVHSQIHYIHDIYQLRILNPELPYTLEHYLVLPRDRVEITASRS